MKKLQKGDYVTDLNERLFNELMVISGNKFLSWYISNIEGDGMFLPRSIVYYRECLVHSEISLLGEELTKSEFKKRAINTFK